MSRYESYSSHRSRRPTSKKPVKKVRFADDLPTYQSTTSSYRSSAGVPLASCSSFKSSTPQPTEQPGPTRHSSLPVMGPSRIHSRKHQVRALEALDAMRAYLKEACNFHGEHMRRALSVPSVDALCALIALVNALRSDVDNRITQREESVLKSLIDTTKRHPHNLLTPDDTEHCTNCYERFARQAHRKRMYREAEHHLLVFVSGQLRLPISLLRDLSPQQRAQRELDAFKHRIKTFNEPSQTTSGINSAPQSPAQRTATTPKSPRSVPIIHVADDYRRAYDLSSQSIDELFPEMAELHLPGSSFDTPVPMESSSRAKPMPPASLYDSQYAPPPMGPAFVGQTHASGRIPAHYSDAVPTGRPQPRYVERPVQPPASPYTGPATYGTAVPSGAAPTIPPGMPGPTSYPQPFQPPPRAPQPDPLLAPASAPAPPQRGSRTPPKRPLRDPPAPPRGKRQSSYPSLQQLQQQQSLHPYKTAGDRY